MTSGHWSLPSGVYSPAPLRMSTRSYNRLPSSRIVGSGAAGYISSENAFKFLQKGITDKTLQLFVLNSERLGGYTQWMHFTGKCTPLKDFKKHYMASLRKTLGQSLFLLSKTWRNKKASKFNHTVLKGLWDIVPGYPARKGEDLVRLGIPHM